jgi:predicted negative regulator of RcsB-dependent stress response
MAEVKGVRHKPESDVVVDRARDFWTKNGRTILIAAGAVILLVGGWLGYKYFIKEPKEQKAADAIWKAEDYFTQDSMRKALSGDGQFAGFDKVISQYGGTKSAELARFYAGAAALKTGDNNKAVKYLSDFSTDAKQIQARAYKLLGDAYSNLGKNNDALSNYKKAAHEFEKDPQSSAEYLFLAAYFADRVMNDKKQAIDLYKELHKKYSNSQFGSEAEKYLAQAGVYKTEE